MYADKSIETLRALREQLSGLLMSTKLEKSRKIDKETKLDEYQDRIELIDKMLKIKKAKRVPEVV